MIFRRPQSRSMQDYRLLQTIDYFLLEALPGINSVIETSIEVLAHLIESVSKLTKYLFSRDLYNGQW